MKNNNHFSIWLFISTLAIFGINACDDTNDSASDIPQCSPECTDDQECINGECRPKQTKDDNNCNSECDRNQVCVNGECRPAKDHNANVCVPECNKNEECIDAKCKPKQNQDDNVCDPACNEDEECIEGTCKPKQNQDDNVCDPACNEDEECVEGVCKPKQNQEDKVCDPACSEEEECVEGVCKCGDKICGDHEICLSGICEQNTETAPGDGEDEKVCEKTCEEDTVCIEGECQPIVPVIQCEPECKDGQFCDKGECKDIPDESCNNCLTGETCVAGVCMCGKTICSENEECKDNICVKLDPCADKTCPAGQACSNGECKVLDVFLNKSSMDVLLSSKSDKLIATRTSTKPLTWTINGTAASDKVTGIFCVTPQNKYSQILNDCIVIDNNKKTETVQFVGLSRKPKNMVVKVTDDSNHSTEATLKLKPYFGMDSFVKLDKMFTYRNTVTPGGFMKLCQYTASTETDKEKVANLGDDSNPYAATSFNEEATAIFDADMYTKFIRPQMIRYKDTYYATRASVVAAARFLVLQFPYDIPYSQGGTNNVVTGRGHYIWAFWAKDGEIDKTNSAQAAVFGLNLTKNDYNSSLTHESLRNTAKPWGTYNSSIADFNLEKNPGRNNKYKFTGLECSGFVTWALRNGRMGLGDWVTTIFGRTGSCTVNGKIERNYRCQTHVNHMLSQIKKENKNALWSESSSNSYNVLNSAFEKLNKLEDSDFKQLDSRDLKTVQAIMNDAKAGDILWHGKYIDKDKNLYANGHIAMIIGLKRDKNGVVTEIDLGEATASSGNKLNRWNIDDFVNKSEWVNTTSQASFLIKMDHVYNYFTDKYKITTESKKSDCPQNVKSGGNCYNYTEMYNEAFHDAIKIKNLPKC